jgi:hypothetical protein
VNFIRLKWSSGLDAYLFTPSSGRVRKLSHIGCKLPAMQFDFFIAFLCFPGVVIIMHPFLVLFLLSREYPTSSWALFLRRELKTTFGWEPAMRWLDSIAPCGGAPAQGAIPSAKQQVQKKQEPVEPGKSSRGASRRKKKDRRRGRH